MVPHSWCRIDQFTEFNSVLILCIAVHHNLYHPGYLRASSQSKWKQVSVAVKTAMLWLPLTALQGLWWICCIDTKSTQRPLSGSQVNTHTNFFLFFIFIWLITECFKTSCLNIKLIIWYWMYEFYSLKDMSHNKWVPTLPSKLWQ